MKVPRTDTLAKYGLNIRHWRAMKPENGCHICGRTDLKLFIDHYHQPGYSRLPDKEKRKHVRGLLCYRDNRYHVGKNTLDSAKAVVAYLQAHHDRCRT